MEAKHGSLGRAMLSSRRKMAQMSKAPPRPLFTSLKDGMQQLIDALLAQLDTPSLRSGVKVSSLQLQGSGWFVSGSHGSDHFDSVIVATPAPAAANLLQMPSSNLASELREINYSSSVTVTLGYDRSVREALPPGFGFLIPRSEGKRILAATFVHNKFPHRAPENRALIRCFLGGARDEAILQLPDVEIVAIVRRELKEIVGLSTEPLFVRVYKWQGAMAQYGVGHLERLERLERYRQQLPGLALAGNGYRGIGVPDCVRSGMEAANQALAFIGLAEQSATSAAKH
jgi:oxygen-dependent protoporphyrinogen oxidase